MKSESDLPRRLRQLVGTLDANGIHSPADAHEALARAGIQRADVLPWANFKHSVYDSYGRKLVHLGSNYELMVMSWAPGDFSAIHDHGHTQWGAVLYLGAAEHAIFRLADNQLTTVGRTTMRSGDVNQVDHDLIHQMGNRGQDPFLSVHLYGCDSVRENVTGDARVFDLFEKQIQFTDGGVFFCLPENDINARQPGPTGDERTTRSHHTMMLDRIRKIQQAGESAPHLNQRGDALERLLNDLPTAAQSCRHELTG